jgi:hypothetical protein
VKLNYCSECQDVYNLTFEKRTCSCGASFGYYKRDGLNAIIGGTAIPLGFTNGSFGSARASRPKSGLGMQFTAFVIPEECDHISVEPMAKTVYVESEGSRLNDSDLKSCVEYNLDQSVLSDAKDVLATVAGANEGDDWYWVLLMKEGNFSLVQGGCDYTGWDCQSSATVVYADTAYAAVALARLDRDSRPILSSLIGQLSGEIPYGLMVYSKE